MSVCGCTQDAGSSVERLLFVVLENLYEAVRIIVASNQTSLELAMRFLEMTKLLGADSVFSSEHIATLQKLWVRQERLFWCILGSGSHASFWGAEKPVTPSDRFQCPLCLRILVSGEQASL